MGFGHSQAEEIGLAWDTTCAVQIRTSGNAGTIRASSLTYYSQDTWHLVELEVSGDSQGSGTMTVFISGAEVLSWTGSLHDTDTTFNRIILRANNWPAVEYFQSIYVMDQDPDTDNTKPLGTGMAVRKVSVAGDTTDLGWTPDTGASNWSRLDDRLLTLTDYVSASTDSALDLYSTTPYSSLASASEQPRAVMVKIWASLAGQVFASLAPVISCGTTRVSGTYSSINPLGAHHIFIQNSNPDTGSSWEVSTVDGLQIGQRVT
jgi:hypothetical protein